MLWRAQLAEFAQAALVLTHLKSGHPWPQHGSGSLAVDDDGGDATTVSGRNEPAPASSWNKETAGRHPFVPVREQVQQALATAAHFCIQ